MYIGFMRKSFKDSLKALEADIQHANTLASDLPREFDGACLQMRISYSPAAHLFLFLVQWTDCHVAGAFGLLRILIYKVYVDGTTTMSTHERKASIREFYAVIFPSLLQLQRGITDMEDIKQKAVCIERYRRIDDEERRKFSNVDVEREDECGICLEMNSKIVLPDCNHALCMKGYREWKVNVKKTKKVHSDVGIFNRDNPFTRTVLVEELKLKKVHKLFWQCSRSQSCPFCRDSLKRVNSGDLWVVIDSRDTVDTATLTRENLKRLFVYIDKLPLVIPDTVFETCDSHVK